MKVPVRHVILLRCSSCKKRFQVHANVEDRYQCPHCGEFMEYQSYKPKPVGPSENK